MSKNLRPTQHLHAVSGLFPKAWQQVSELRKGKGKDLPDWPDWCFIPMAGTVAIMSGGRGFPEQSICSIAQATALITWRYSQGIYRFDRQLFECLLDTSIYGDIPV